MPDVILVIDDDPSLLSILAEALTADDMSPVLARSAADALRQCQEGTAPGALVIDLDMRDGFTVLAKIECAIEDTVPVVALSSSPRQLLNAGLADAVLMKPFEVGELRRGVQRACCAHRGASW
jgi:DNA-binding response OmpR family regulator